MAQDNPSSGCADGHRCPLLHLLQDACPLSQRGRIFGLDVSLQENMQNVGLTVRNTFIDIKAASPSNSPPTTSAPADIGGPGGLSRLFRRQPPEDRGIIAEEFKGAQHSPTAGSTESPLPGLPGLPLPMRIMSDNPQEARVA